MFATIAGGYPFGPLPGATDSFQDAREQRASGALGEEAFTERADAWVTEIVAEQASNGLAMVHDAWARWPGTTPTALARELLAGRVTPQALVTAWRWADDGIDAPVKQLLPGPWSAARDLAGPDASAADRRAIARDLVDALVAAGTALRASMVPVLQFEEPAIPAIGDDPAAWEELGEVLTGLCERLPDIHRSLSITGGAADPAGIPVLAALTFQSFVVDVVTAGVDGWRLIHALPAETGVVVGASDATMARQDDPEMLVWAAAIAAEHKERGHVRVGIGTSGSLAGIPRFYARRKLESLGMAVRLAKMGPLSHVARALQEDPATCRIPELRRLWAHHQAALAAAESRSGGPRA